MRLNTSYVNVNLIAATKPAITVISLNTSYVNVNLRWAVYILQDERSLNTSYVNVNRFLVSIIPFC